MRRTTLSVCLVFALGAHPAVRGAPADAPDVDIEKGIRLVEEGEYDAAILTLDTAARRLAPDPARSRELARAYLYLGVAYLAKGHETSARARFRDALARARDLELEPEKFAPRVIEVFEKARQDMAAAVAPAPKKGSRKGVIVAGAVAAAAGGAALALRGPGVESPPPFPSFGGTLDPQGSLAAQHTLTRLPRSGHCEARLSWSDGRTEVRMFVLDAAGGLAVAETSRVTDSSSVAQWSCSQSATYRIELFLQEPLMRVTYELQFTVS